MYLNRHVFVMIHYLDLLTYCDKNVMHLSFAAAQLSMSSPIMRMMMMQQMMGGSQSGSGTSSASGSAASGAMGSFGSGGAMSGGLAGLLNNPALLCRKTENLRMLPCRRWRGLCDMVSLQTYGFPGLLKCSPMGVGCCIKDALSLTLVQSM